MAEKNPSITNHPVRLPLPITSALNIYRHHCIPGLNLMVKEQNVIKSPEEIIKLYSEPEISTRKPLPCLVRDHFVPLVDNEDPALKLVHTKFLYQRRKNQIIDLFNRKYKKGRGKCQINNIKPKKINKKTRAPYIITRLADHLSKNPDKNFKGLYNWYFDNALSAIQTSEQQYLLHAGGEQLNKLCISSVDLDVASPSIPLVNLKYNIPLEEDGQIFHIFQSRTKDRIGVRQRDSCKVFVFDEDRGIDNIVLKSFSINSGKHSFVSADITNEEICTVDANRVMKLWTVSNQKRICEASLPKSNSFLSDKFVRVEFSADGNSITAIDRKNVYIFDTRSNLDAPVSQWSCENFVEMCEEISLMVSSVTDANYFIGCTHSCLLLDPRYGFVQKWTHMLPQTPTVGHSTSVELESGDTKQLLILSSQCSNEIVAICNNTSSESSVTCPPFSLPTRTDTLYEARARGTLYQSIVQEKFEFCMIGLTSCDVNEYPTLFSLVSTGDIFQQKLLATSKRSTKLSKQELFYLKDWEDHLTKLFTRRKKPRLVVTHTVGMEDLFSKLEEVEIPEWTAKPANLEKLRRFSKKELESYSDLLAPTLLDDYGVHNDSDWENEDEVVPNSSSTTVTKVQNWLDTGKNTFGVSDNEDDLDELSSGGALTSDCDKSKTDLDDRSIISFELSEGEL